MSMEIKLQKNFLGIIRFIFFMKFISFNLSSLFDQIIGIYSMYLI